MKTITPSKERNGHATIATKKEIIQVREVTLDVKLLTMTIEGTSQLVVHAWDEKIKRQMLDKHMGIASAGKEKKNPVECFKSTLYRMPNPKDGFGIPACSLKKAAVTAANDVELKKTDMRRAFHVLGDMLKIEAPAITTPLTDEDSKYGKEIAYEHKHGASMRQDMVRVNMGQPDVRFRAQFPIWKVTFQVQYNARVITESQLVNLFNVAGFGVGIFEYRPEKSGSWGMFKVV